MPLMTLMIGNPVGKYNCQICDLFIALIKIKQFAPVFALVLEFDHTIRKATGIRGGYTILYEFLVEPEIRVIGVNFDQGKQN